MDFSKIINEIKSKPVYLLLGPLLLLMIAFPSFFNSARRRRKRFIKYSPVRRYGRRRKKRAVSKGPVKRRTGTKAKKPWQIKGSKAARLHMAKLRRMR